jgi:hypothetical protein
MTRRPLPHVTFLGPEGLHKGLGESIKDTAQVPGHRFDGIGLLPGVGRDAGSVRWRPGVERVERLTDQ